MSQFIPVNTSQTYPTPLPKHFTLTAQTGTDIYAAPAHGYVWTAPILHRKITCSRFKHARVTVSFPWTTIYDQGGLLLSFPAPGSPSPDASNASTRDRHPRWVKAGIEINDGKPWASAVARENWADWSLSAPPAGVVSGDGKSVKAVIEFERHGDALMVWVSAPGGGERSMVREAQWVFLDGRGDGEAFLGVYACTPDPEKSRGAPLEVTYEDFDIVEN